VVLPLWVVENRPSQLLWPLAYTTACTTVQAVISFICLTVRWLILYPTYLVSTSRNDRYWRDKCTVYVYNTVLVYTHTSLVVIVGYSNTRVHVFPDSKSVIAFLSRDPYADQWLYSDEMTVRPSVCLPVCPSHAGIESKRLHISSKSCAGNVCPGDILIDFSS